jgi:SRSO17 transposase
MTTEQIAGLAPALTEFLGSFKSCFGECRTRDHFAVYCRGLLSNLPRKSVEPMAVAAGSTVRALQLFLTERDWDHRRLRDQLQQRVAARHLPAPGVPREPDDLGVIGLIEETSVPKSGPKTPGVKRQYCGALGKVDNCLVTVHLGCRHGDFKTLLDSDLYLPQDWAEERERCRDAGLPDGLPYRPKTQIALEQVRHALGNGLHFDWHVFDEGYGKDPSFLFGLDALGQTWIGEVPKNFRCWAALPPCRSLRKECASKKVCNVVRWSPAFLCESWQAITFGRQSVEPVVWDVRAAQVHLVRDGRPTDRTYWLIVAWNRQTDEYKYFVSNAPPGTDLGLLLRVAFCRADVEHLFRVAKSEVGLSHYEGRKYVGLMRHLTLCQLVLLFLAEQTGQLNAPLLPPTVHPADSPRGETITRPGSGPRTGADAPAAPRHDGADRGLAELAVRPLAGAPPPPSHRPKSLGARVVHPPVSPTTQLRRRSLPATPLLPKGGFAVMRSCAVLLGRGG